MGVNDANVLRIMFTKTNDVHVGGRGTHNRACVRHSFA